MLEDLGHITDLQWAAAVTFVHKGPDGRNSVASLVWCFVSGLPSAGAALLLAHQVLWDIAVMLPPDTVSSTRENISEAALPERWRVHVCWQQGQFINAIIHVCSQQLSLTS